MKYEAISLLVLVAMGGSRWLLMVEAVDIFDKLGETTPAVVTPKAPGDTGKETPTCVQDLIPDAPLSYTSKANIAIQDALDKMPKTPDMPRLGDLWRDLNAVIAQPSIKDKIVEAAKVIQHHQKMTDMFANQWIVYFDKQRHDAMDHIQEVIQEKNEEIKSFFKRHFEEFDGVCLPDENECLGNIQQYLEDYSEKVAKNTEACNEYADRQLEQHAQWLEVEKNKLGKLFQMILECVKNGVIACVGNVVTSTIKFGTEALKSFGAAMRRAAASIVNKLAKFKECVIDRKKLLDGGQAKIAEKAKACLRKQPGVGGVFSK